MSFLLIQLSELYKKNSHIKYTFDYIVKYVIYLHVHVAFHSPDKKIHIDFLQKKKRKESMRHKCGSEEDVLFDDMTKKNVLI